MEVVHYFQAYSNSSPLLSEDFNMRVFVVHDGFFKKAIKKGTSWRRGAWRLGWVLRLNVQLQIHFRWLISRDPPRKLKPLRTKHFHGWVRRNHSSSSLINIRDCGRTSKSNTTTLVVGLWAYMLRTSMHHWDVSFSYLYFSLVWVYFIIALLGRLLGFSFLLLKSQFMFVRLVIRMLS